jgi:protoheme IX farnesyltransferase
MMGFTQTTLWLEGSITMNTTAIVPSRLSSASRLVERLPYFVTLMKPRVMALALFTALVGLMVAPIRLDPLPGFIAMLAIAAGAGAAGALNMWYDADIDAVMARTAMRPIPRSKVSKLEALVFGLVLGVIAVTVLALATNLAAAALLAGTIGFYVVVYTAWLKRATPQNIVIGGAAGALPPVIGWAAATGQAGLEPLVLFLIIFLWTPPHFWALALNRSDDYARAGVPMLPVVAGRAATTRQILIYSGLLVIASELPWALGFAGAIYGVIAAACGGLFLLLAYRLNKSGADRHAAHRLFLFSISYLFVLFAVLLVEPGGGSFSRVAAPHAGRNGGWIHAEVLPGMVRGASGLTNLSAWEV